MKQTDLTPIHTVRAVNLRIRNAGNDPVFTGDLDNSAPHYATYARTNRDFHHNQTLRFALRGIKAFEGIAVNSGSAK